MASSLISSGNVIDMSVSGSTGPQNCSKEPCPRLETIQPHRVTTVKSITHFQGRGDVRWLDFLKAVTTISPPEYMRSFQNG